MTADQTAYIVIGYGDCVDTNVIIPASYNGLPVVGIGDEAFSGCSSLTSITYTGTKAEWKKTRIEKSASGITCTVICSDGTIEDCAF